jgi:hypothetical protein
MKEEIIRYYDNDTELEIIILADKSKRVCYADVKRICDIMIDQAGGSLFWEYKKNERVPLILDIEEQIILTGTRIDKEKDIMDFVTRHGVGMSDCEIIAHPDNKGFSKKEIIRLKKKDV